MESIIISDEMKNRSVAHFGNPYRILKMLEKAEKGEKITFVAIGGSITQRYNASLLEKCYAALLAKWLKEKYPAADINYINAGIGATGSLIGVHRLQRDVLNYDPDFVTVEFSVNEGDCDATVEAYDNLIFNIMNYKTSPAVLCIGMVNNGGGSAQKSHIKVAAHYDIPYISYRDAVWQEIEEGRLCWTDLSNDNIHPHDAGHELTAGLVTEYIEKAVENGGEHLCDNTVSKPLVNNCFSKARMCYVDDITPEDWGCFAKEEVNLNRIPFGWVARESGKPITFKFHDCSRIYMLFERTNRGDGGKATARVMNKEIELDADFKDGWGIYYNNALIYNGDKPADLVLTVTPQLEEGKFFAIAGIMIS